jgi:molybdate transport system ATP-binding protein
LSDSLIKIHHVHVILNGTSSFDQLSFDWKEGTHWAIVADSGALLTAFLETVRGNSIVSSGSIHRPFAADYLAEKQEEGAIHSYRNLIAYVSQKYEFRNRSNLQNFYFQQRFNSSESEEAATAGEYLTEVDPKVPGPWTVALVSNLLRLEHLLDKAIIKLSNGETRRLALALGLLRQPTIYLMDQPMTGLDVRSRAEFGAVLKSIIAAGVHVLISTSADEIPEGITHIAKLDKSGIQKIWTKKEYHSLGVQPEFTNSWNWDELDVLLPKSVYQRKSIIKLENVTIKYGDKTILDQFNWEVKPGSRWLLKGPNGSGKSTLLSLLIGENPQAYSQNFWLFDRKRGTGESIWDVKRPTGFVAPELSRYFPSNQTCRKVILSGLFDTMGLFKKVTEAQEALASKWMKLFDLESLAELPISRLSLENQRWALLARALIKQPELLILDEASQGMDEFQRRLFKDTVQQICERSNITLIYVSHYAEDVPEGVGLVMELG